MWTSTFLTFFNTRFNNSSTNISICRTIIKSGVKKGQECGRPATINNQFCGLHKPRGNKIKPAPIEMPVETTDDKQVVSKFSSSFVSKMMSPFTRKNKVVPVGGRRRKSRKGKSRKVKRNKKY